MRAFFQIVSIDISQVYYVILYIWYCSHKVIRKNNIPFVHVNLYLFKFLRNSSFISNWFYWQIFICWIIDCSITIILGLLNAYLKNVCSAIIYVFMLGLYVYVPTEIIFLILGNYFLWLDWYKVNQSSFY